MSDQGKLLVDGRFAVMKMLCDLVNRTGKIVSTHENIHFTSREGAKKIADDMAESIRIFDAVLVARNQVLKLGK